MPPPPAPDVTKRTAGSASLAGSFLGPPLRRPASARALSALACPLPALPLPFSQHRLAPTIKPRSPPDTSPADKPAPFAAARPPCPPSRQRPPQQHCPPRTHFRPASPRAVIGPPTCPLSTHRSLPSIHLIAAHQALHRRHHRRPLPASPHQPRHPPCPPPDIASITDLLSIDARPPIGIAVSTSSTPPAHCPITASPPPSPISICLARPALPAICLPSRAPCLPAYRIIVIASNTNKVLTTG